MKTRFKTSMGLIGLLLLLAGMTFAADATISGIWTDQTGHMQLEIRQTSRGLDARASDENYWVNYSRISADYFRSANGQARLRFVGDQLQYTPRDGQKTWILYTNNNRRDNGYDPGYGSYGRDRNDQNRHDQEWNDRDWDRFDFRSMEGTWYNQSTGIRIEIKETRRNLRVRFNRDSWSDLRRYRNGMFIDEDGNQIRLSDHGLLEYQSVNGDLTMVFTNRPGSGYNNRIFRGHTDFDRF
ncbi:MAG: hypothetical protein KDC28_17675 [Saprospiraceae bacterium]|nr:hypothetical protein [Saprospiraceae bacterium]MCB9318832.1 hypothetical protein [Lewinellaceae bacterium]